jgi:AcrR family transcriptional regulator
VTAVDFQRARSPAQQERRREAILTAARAMIDQLPLAEVSLRELSRQVGLSKSNVVRYFPTREAVFLAILAEDWASWLCAVEAQLPKPDRRRRPHARNEQVAGVLAATLATHRRFCDLLAACQSVLEHNVPIGTARESKLAALSNLNRLAALVRARVPELSEADCLEFAGIVWVITAGAWPMANPPPIITAALADPRLSSMCIDFVPALASSLTVVLDGLSARQRARRS